jgi:hypothetical protein
MSLKSLEMEIIVPSAEAEKAILGNIGLESQNSGVGGIRAAVCVVCSSVCVCRCSCNCNCLGLSNEA